MPNISIIAIIVAKIGPHLVLKSVPKNAVIVINRSAAIKIKSLIRSYWLRGEKNKNTVIISVEITLRLSKIIKKIAERLKLLPICFEVSEGFYIFCFARSKYV